MPQIQTVMETLRGPTQGQRGRTYNVDPQCTSGDSFRNTLKQRLSSLYQSATEGKSTPSGELRDPSQAAGEGMIAARAHPSLGELQPPQRKTDTEGRRTRRRGGWREPGREDWDR